MSFIEKCTTMRRMALIYEGNGAIAWEGVNIEGFVVLKEYRPYSGDYQIPHVVSFPEEQLQEFINHEWGQGLLVSYQDPPHKEQDTWVPREDSPEYLQKKNEEKYLQ